jgi:hypothetical protein
MRKKGENVLEPFEVNDPAWTYFFLEEYLGQAWTDETTPPPEHGSYNDDPELTMMGQRPAWKCKFPHAFGRYIMSGRRNTCPGRGNTKDNAFQFDMGYNIYWPKL